MSVFFSMLFMLCVKPLCSIVLLPFSAILTNLILFIFHVPNTTVKPFCNLKSVFAYLCLLNPIWGCYVPGQTHRQSQYSIMTCISLLCFSFWLCVEKKNLLIFH